MSEDVTGYVLEVTRYESEVTSYVPDITSYILDVTFCAELSVYGTRDLAAPGGRYEGEYAVAGYSPPYTYQRAESVDFTRSERGATNLQRQEQLPSKSFQRFHEVAGRPNRSLRTRSSDCCDDAVCHNCHN